MNYSQKQEGENHPGHEENANCIVFHVWRGGLVGIGDTRAGDEEGREREPECTVGGKCYMQKKVLAMIDASQNVISASVAEFEKGET